EPQRCRKQFAYQSTKAGVRHRALRAWSPRKGAWSMDTDELIARLGERCEPIRPLPPPWIRAAEWLGFAMPYVALVALVVSPRADLMTKMSDGHFIVEEVAAIATAITAAVAAFATVIPGYGRKLLFLPLLPLFIWLGSLGWGFAHDWIRSRP